MRKNTPKIFLICGLLLTLGIFLSIVLYFSLSNSNKLKNEKLLSDSYNNIHNRISYEIERNLDALYALRAYYKANDGFTREEFKSFGSFYTDNIKSIQALEWVPEITLAQRDSFELATRKEGIENFQITTRVGDSLIRAESRPIYYPVYYIQPLKGNEAAMGFDPGESSKVRSEAIYKAIETGNTATSNIMKIIQKSTPHKAILVFVPVYVNDKLTGMIEGVYLMEQLVNTALENLELDQGMEITVTGTNGLEELLFGEKSNNDVFKGIVQQGTIDIADQTWEIKVGYSEIAHFDFFDPLWILIGCLTLTVLLVKVVFDTLTDNRVQLIKNLKELRQKNEDLEQYAYAASHDLQEPLHSLQSLVNLIKSDLEDKVDDNGKQYLQFLFETTERMSLLIKNLLNYSRIGRMEEIEMVNCNTVIELVKKDLAHQIENANAKIEVENTLPILKGYPTSLHQLFQNLISNAIKFQPEGQDPVIKISSKHINQGWQFKVEDNGIGIPEDSLEKVFVIFKRLHSSSKYKGTGVGLANCKKIVDLHNGSIWVESTLGKGSTFYFTINLI